MSAAFVANAQKFYRRTGLPAFFSWWFAELKELVPVKFRQWLRLENDVLLLKVDDDQLECILINVNGTLECGVFSLDEMNLAGQIREAVASKAGKQLLYVLQLPEQSVLLQTVFLPLAAEDNLEQVLSYELDRVTPFTPDQVYLDFRVIERDEKQARLKVQLAMVKKTRLDDCSEKLHSKGVLLDGADLLVESGLSGFNLLPEKYRKREDASRARLNRLLIFASCLILFLGLWQSIALRQQAIDELESRLADVRLEASQSTRLKKQLQMEVEAANYLVREKQAYPLISEAILELSQALPDDAWAERLEFKNGLFEMRGFSPAANALIQELGKMPHLGQPEVVGAITENRLIGKEQFNIKIQPVTDPGAGQ